MNAQQSITGTTIKDRIQLNETRETKAAKWTYKFRDPSFRDKLVMGFTYAITVSPLILLIGMYIVQVYVWR